MRTVMPHVILAMMLGILIFPGPAHSEWLTDMLGDAISAAATGEPVTISG